MCLSRTYFKVLFHGGTISKLRETSNQKKNSAKWFSFYIFVVPFSPLNILFFFWLKKKADVPSYVTQKATLLQNFVFSDKIRLIQSLKFFIPSHFTKLFCDPFFPFCCLICFKPLFCVYIFSVVLVSFPTRIKNYFLVVSFPL